MQEGDTTTMLVSQFKTIIHDGKKEIWELDDREWRLIKEEELDKKL